MASHNPQDNTQAADDEPDQFIDSQDVLAEIDDDGDQPMEDDEEPDGDEDHLEGEGADVEIVVEDNSIQHFPNHNASVFAVSMHPTQPIAASGGQDDLGYLWNTQTGDVVATLEGHTESVTSTAFSSDGELVACGAMDGKVRLWRHVGKDTWTIWEFLTELQGPDEVMVSRSLYVFPGSRFSPSFIFVTVKWLRWHPRGPVLLAGSADSTVWLWQRRLIISLI